MNAGEGRSRRDEQSWRGQGSMGSGRYRDDMRRAWGQDEGQDREDDRDQQRFGNTRSFGQNYGYNNQENQGWGQYGGQSRGRDQRSQFGSEGMTGRGWSQGSDDWSQGRQGNQSGHDWSNQGWSGQSNQGQSGQDWSNQGRFGQSNQGQSGQDWSSQGRFGQSNQGHSGQDWSNQGRFGQSNQGQSGQTGQGQFAGKGPRNYKRADDRIEEEINERLTQHGTLDATEIEVTVQNGEVTLKGSVENRQAKRLAEEVAEGVSGVKDVTNQIKVQQSKSGGSQHGESSGTENQTSGKNQQRKAS